MQLFNNKNLKLWVARLKELYYLKVLEVQTQSLTCSETGELFFIGILQKTNHPQQWMVKKIFYNTHPKVIKLDGYIHANFGVPSNSSLNA